MTGNYESGPTQTYVVDMDDFTVDRQWAWQNSQEAAIAVLDTVKQHGVFHPDLGTEYTLAGQPTGTTYPGHGLTGGQFGRRFYDATTDGNHIYAWDYEFGSAFRFDLNWSNPVELFNVPGQADFMGITYDPTNDSLWVSGWDLQTIRNYTLGGVLLSSFDPGSMLNSALALNPLDGTLWFSAFGTSQFQNFSKSGTFLGSEAAPADLFGGEIVAVPEPRPLLSLLVILFSTVILFRVSKPMGLRPNSI